MRHSDLRHLAGKGAAEWPKGESNKYPKAFRQMALERMRTCDNVSALAQELGVDRTVLYHWRDQAPGGAGMTAASPVRELRKEIRDLKRVLAEKALEVDFFKGALQKVEARRQRDSGTGATASTTQIREVMPMQGGLSVERMCHWQGQPGGILPVVAGAGAGGRSMAVRSAIQQIALEHRRRYGYRRVTAELRRRGMVVNHKRVAAIMREDNLLAVQS